MPPSAKRKADERPRSEELRRVRDRELELKRMSGEISCSDCRRLKLKCDKKLPCSSCVRRGVESLCPLGATRNDSSSNRRIVLAGSSHCHFQRSVRKLALLNERIRALEDALALESEARGGSGSHPLLAEDQLAIKQCIDDDDEEEDEEDEEEQMLSTFGTLSIDESRTMRYLGPAASESALVMEVLENNASRHLAITGPSIDGLGGLSDDINHLSKSFPFSHSLINRSGQSLLEQIVSHLPPFDRATALYEAFFRNLSWFISPVERSQFVTEVVPLFYPHRKPISPLNVREENVHDLALLYIIFAGGAAGDLTQSPINDEAERYRVLAGAAMSVKSIMHGATLTGVQTVFLLGAYDVFSGRKSNLEDAWKVVSLGATLAAAIGLHRDPSRWGFEPKMMERRRRVFWWIYQIDTWRSLESGRPALFRPSVVDCELPHDEFASLGENGEMLESVTHWQFRFLRDIAIEVCEKVCSARPLKYRAVLELDRRIRDFGVHTCAIQHRPRKNDLGIDTDFDRIYPLISVWDKEECVMYIHRNFFARAIMDFPDNPMRSPFAASFLSTYRSAANILRICREQMEHMYLIALRIWQIWSLCLSCGVIVGAVAALGSSVSFATSAFVELEYAIALFEKYGDHKVAKNSLPLLRRIRERAVNALRRPRSRQPSDKFQDIIPYVRGRCGDVGEELLILRGSTRVIEQRTCRTTSPNPQTAAETATKTDSTIKEVHGMTAVNPSSIGRSQDFPITLSREQSIFVKDTTASTSISSNPVQKSITSLIPSSDDWLFELEQLLGSSSGAQQSSGAHNEHQPGQAFTPPGGHLDPSATMPDLSGLKTAFGTVPDGNFSATDAIMSDALLEQAVSTEDWRVFMRQSGFSSTPPFDFASESIDPQANTSQAWDSAIPKFT